MGPRSRDMGPTSCGPSLQEWASGVVCGVDLAMDLGRVLGSLYLGYGNWLSGRGPFPFWLVGSWRWWKRLIDTSHIWTHSVNSGTRVLERGWTLFYAGVAKEKGVWWPLLMALSALSLCIAILIGGLKGCIHTPLIWESGRHCCLCVCVKLYFRVAAFFFLCPWDGTLT